MMLRCDILYNHTPTGIQMRATIDSAKSKLLSYFSFTEDEILVENMRSKLFGTIEDHMFQATRQGDNKKLLVWMTIHNLATELLQKNSTNKTNWNFFEFKQAFRLSKAPDLYAQQINYMLNNIYSNNLGLLHAVTDIQLATWMLNNGASPNLRTNSTNLSYSIGGKTPLHTVRDIEIIKLLLTRGADINICDEADRPPLWYHAYENFSIEHINLFIDHGATINISDSTGKNLLYLFTWVHPDTEMQKKLLRLRGINADIKNQHNETALHYAIKSNDPELVELLLNNSADTNSYDNNHTTPLLLAVMDDKDTKIQQMLIQNGADVNATDKYGRTALFYVTDCDVTKELLQHGANIFITDKTDKNMLYFLRNESVINTIKTIYPDALRQLSNQPNRYNETPLHWATDIDAIKALIISGADVNAQSVRGTTPLHWAANAQIAQLLINNGADPNARNDRGATPLHWVESPEIAKTLIDNGADINICDEDGESPLDYAIANKNTSVADYLQSLT